MDTFIDVARRDWRPHLLRRVGLEPDELHEEGFEGGTLQECSTRPANRAAKVNTNLKCLIFPRRDRTRKSC